MDEARRFLRLVIPGLVFGVEVTILFLLLRPDQFDHLNKLLAKDSGLAVLSAGLLGSGALGYIFSSIHHQLLAHSESELMNHKFVLDRLVKEDLLRLRDTKKPRDMSRQEAWIILTALWHERTGDGLIKNMETRAKDLMDLAHSLGTVRIATVCAPILAILLAWKGGVFSCALVPATRFIVAVLFELALLYVFHDGYSRTARMAQGVIDEVLSDALVIEQKNLGGPENAKTGHVVETWPLILP